MPIPKGSYSVEKSTTQCPSTRHTKTYILHQRERSSETITKHSFNENRHDSRLFRESFRPIARRAVAEHVEQRFARAKKPSSMMNLTIGKARKARARRRPCVHAQEDVDLPLLLCKMSRNRVTREVYTSGSCENTWWLSATGRRNHRLYFLPHLSSTLRSFRLPSSSDVFKKRQITLVAITRTISECNTSLGHWFHG